MKFDKWQALGNSYVILEAADLPWDLTPDRIRRLCDPDFGIGSDGILLISPAPGADEVARIRIFNPDGSEAGLSGNGVRIAVLHLYRQGRTGGETFTVQTAAGPVTPTVTSARTCSVAMGRAATVSPDFPSGSPDGRGTVPSAGREWAFRHVAVGNPQCAIRIDDAATLAAIDLPAVGPAIERSELFPNRSNVSFWTPDGPAIRARIFERGVGETLSSGTGATGAAVAAHLDGTPSPVTVRLDGGELEVGIGPDLDVTLSGWAEPVLSGTLSREVLDSLSDSVTRSDR